LPVVAEQKDGPVLGQTGPEAEVKPPSQPKPESSSQLTKPEQTQLPQFNLSEALQKEFGLTPEQINQLKQSGVNIDQFTEENLADPKKMTELLEGLEGIGNLTDEQKAKINQFKEDLNQVLSTEGQTQSKEELRQRIQAKKEEIKRSDLPPDEKDKALAELAEMEQLLEEQERQSELQTPEKQKVLQERRIQQVKEKATQYLQYAGLGIVALFIILILQGVRGQGGGN
jgi:hypothetical protein